MDTLALRRFPDFAVIADLWILTFVLAPQS